MLLGLESGSTTAQIAAAHAGAGWGSRGSIVSSEWQNMVTGDLYDPLDPELVDRRIRARDLCQRLNVTGESQQPERTTLLRDLFGAGGESVWMQPPFYCDYGSNIYLGQRVFFNFNCIVLDVCPVRIGSFSMFGPGVQI